MDFSPPELTRLLIDHLPNQIFWKDPDGVYLGCNAAFAKVVGLESPDDIVGMTDFDFNLDRSTAESYRSWDNQVLTSGEPLRDLLEEYATSYGRSGFVLTSKVPLRNSQGEVMGVLGLCVDVTERVRAEQALARSELRLRLSTEKAGVAVWEYDVAQDSMWRSQLHDQLYGLKDIETWTSEVFHNSVHPEDRELAAHMVQASLSPGGPDHYSFDYRVVWPDRSVHWLSVSAEVTERDHDGNAKRVCGCLADVSERKSIEEALRQRETALREAQAIAHLANWNYDVKTDTLDCSEELYRIVGIPLAEPMAKELIQERVYTDDLASYKDAIQRLHAQEEVRHSFRLVRPGGEVRWIAAQGVTDFDELGEPRRIFGTVLDITEQNQRDEERTKLEEQFHHAQKMEAIGRLAGGVAHEFNNLLTVINSYTELVLQGLGEEHQLRSDAVEILRAGRQAASLTRQLLAFSRKQPMDVQLLDVNELVRGVFKMLGKLIGEDVDFQVKLMPDIGMVKADASQIEQVLLNLALNARDAMPDGGTFRIETTHLDTFERSDSESSGSTSHGCILLTVSDTGTGMEPEILEQIFDPFFTTKEQDRGTGLGLSTVYGVVEQSGGYITVSSEPGQGTCFRIYLPSVPSETEERTAAQKSSSAGGRETILLVEDDRAVRRLVERSLTALGYGVVCAENGEQGLREFEARPEGFALVLTDVIMPGMSGKEMIERISVLGSKIKVLYMSGYAENVIAHNGVLDDGVQFLPKPFTLANLQSKVQRVLQSQV